MNCWRHSISVCCGNFATRIFLLKEKDPHMIAYCDKCAEEMTKSWSGGGWMVDLPESKVGRSLEWEELSPDAIALLEVQET